MLRYHEFSSFTNWVQESAEYIYNSIKAAYSAHNQPIICLAGGTTPIPVYNELCSYLCKNPKKQFAAHASSIQEPLLTQQKTLIIIPGDERITSESPQQVSNRNETMLRKAFHALLAIKNAELISWYNGYAGYTNPITSSNDTDTKSSNTNQTGSLLCTFMNEYMNKLKQSRSPLFDCVVLGVGADGHVAGIFDAHASAVLEQASASAAFTAPAEPRQRVSLLPHILRDSSATLILMHKHGKEAVIKTILAGTHNLINESICKNAEFYCYTGTL